MGTRRAFPACGNRSKIHCIRLASVAGLCGLAASNPAHAITVVPTYDSTVTSNVNAGNIENAFNYVCLQYKNLFSDPINVNITVVVGNSGLGASSTSILGTLSYAQTRTFLINDATSADDTTAIASLGGTDPTPAGSLFGLSKANGKALSVVSNDSTNDGTFTFNGNFTYSYDPANRAVAAKVDFIGVAEHEVSEIMGRIPGLGTNFFGEPDYLPFDLFRYTAPNARNLSDAAGVYFSINSGVNNLKAFNFANGDGSDPQDWASGSPDACNAFGGNSNEMDPITPVDVTAVDVIGYNVTNLVWSGAANGTTWDIFNVLNWNNGATTKYTDSANILFNDTGSGTNISLNQSVYTNSVTINSSVNNYNISGTGSITGLGGLTKSGSSTFTLATANTYSGPTNVSAGTMTLTGSIASTSLSVSAGAVFNANGSTNRGLSTGLVLVSNGSTNVTAVGGVSNPVAFTISSATIGSTGVVTLNSAPLHASRTVLITSGLTFAGTPAAPLGVLNLKDNDLIVRNGSLGTITAALGSGLNLAGGSAGYWAGNGINSSTAHGDTTHLTTLGAILNNNGLGTAIYSSGAFDNQNTVVTDVLVKYTYYGDADLNGKVDGTDYSRIDNGFLFHLTGWFNGDFNYDGVVNGTDYTLIDNTFNQQGAKLSALLASPSVTVADQIAAGASVPEPSALGLLGGTALAFVGRRRSVKNRTLATARCTTSVTGGR